MARQISIGTFDNFNIAIAGIKGTHRAGGDLIYETLMTRSQDEVTTEYGLLAESVPASRRFCLGDLPASQGRPMARRQASDAGRRHLLLRDVEAAQPDASRPIIGTSSRPKRSATVKSNSHSTRRAIANCPRIVGELTVLPKHWWEGTDSKGASATSPQPRWRNRWVRALIGSRNSSPAARSNWSGSRITGGASSPVQIGQNNFDEMHFEFFRDNQVALEAFKADQADWITENSAKQWATAYDFPAIADKRVHQGGISDQRFGPHAGLRLQSAPAINSRTRGCAAHSTMRSISRK